MITLKTDKKGEMPKYMTEASAGADVCASKQIIIGSGRVELVPTGLYIDKYLILGNQIPVLKLYIRSSMAYKHKIVLANSVAIIDADYEDEIKLLVHNLGECGYVVERGQRIAQMTLEYVRRIENAKQTQNKRVGGFGSTGSGKKT